jgi:phosphoglycerate dehydrogenase-like enzyme
MIPPLVEEANYLKTKAITIIMVKFKRLVLYDLKSKPLEKEFVDKLSGFAESVKIVFAEGEYKKCLNSSDLEGSDALIARIFDNYDDALFEKSSLKYIGAMHTDISHYNLQLLKKKGIILTNVAGYATEAVAELTISALLNISRQTHDAMNFVKKGNWGFENFVGGELKGKTLGIIGLGRIGGRVAEIAKGFGMKIIYYSKQKENVPYEFMELSDLLKKADVLTLHCNLTEETKNILNKSNLSLMKSGAILLNSARMELVDLEALYDLCRQKRIFAWFDELQDEVWRSKVRNLDNVYLTPDYGWMTKEAQERVREMTLKNISSFLEGKSTTAI